MLRPWNVQYALPIHAPSGQPVGQVQLGEVILAASLPDAYHKAEQLILKYKHSLGTQVMLISVGEIFIIPKDHDAVPTRPELSEAEEEPTTNESSEEIPPGNEGPSFPGDEKRSTNES